MSITREQAIRELQRREARAELEKRGVLSQSENEPSLARKALDTVSDISHSVPNKLLKGLARTGDLISYPLRKPLEAFVDRPISTLEEQLPEYQSKTMAGRIVGKGAEVTGDMLGGAGLGTSIAKAGISVAPKIVSKTAPLVEKVLTKGRNFITNPAEWFGNPKPTSNFFGNPKNVPKGFTYNPQPNELKQLANVGARTGLISGSLQEMGADPLGADIGASASVLAKPIYQTIANKIAYRRQLSSFETKALKELEERIGSENLDETLKKLNKFKESPVANYVPSTAEVVNNVGLSQVQRAAEGVAGYPQLGLAKEKGSEALTSHLANLYPEKAQVSDLPSHVSNVYNAKEARLIQNKIKAEQKENEILSLFSGNHNPEKTGEIVRPGIEKQLTARERLREQKSQPLYKNLREIKETTTPKNTADLIDEMIEEGAKDPVKKLLLVMKKALIPNKLKSGELKIFDNNKTHLQNQEELLRGYPKELRDKLAKVEDMNFRELELTPGELDNVKQQLNKMITIANKSGERGTAHHLKLVKEQIVKDLESFPEAAKATQTYRKYSKPINEITDDRALSKSIQQDVYKNAYKIGPAEIPDLFTKSTGSIRNAKNLLNVLRKDKKTINSLRNHIEEDFLSSVRDAKGNINESHVQSWVKSHPGAKVFHPEFFKKSSNSIQFFNKDVKGTSNANIGSILQTKSRSDIAKKELDKFYKKNDELFSDILGKNNKGLDSDKIASQVLSGNNKVNKMDKLLDILHQDKSGKSIEGLRHAILDDLNKKTSLASIGLSGENNISYNGLRNYLRENGKAISKVMTKEQIKGLRDIEDILKRRVQVQSVATNSNSHTSPNLQNSIFDAAQEKLLDGVIESAFKAVKLGSIAGPAIKGAKNYARNSKKAVIDTFLSNPLKAKEILNKYKSIPEKSPKLSISNADKKLLQILGIKNLISNS